MRAGTSAEHCFVIFLKTKSNEHIVDKLQCSRHRCRAS